MITLLFALLLVWPTTTQATFGDTSVYAGQVKFGDGLNRTEAYYDFPSDLASDGDGNFYIADTFNGAIRKINSAGTVSTVAGQGGYGDRTGAADQALFTLPLAIAVDDTTVFVAEATGKIKKIVDGQVTTIKDDLERPTGLFARNDTLYITDFETDRLYSMDYNGNNMRTITSSLDGPKKLYVRTSNDYAYISNAADFTVVRVKLSNGSITTLAGQSGNGGSTNGACTSSEFKNLWGITVIQGNSLDEDDIYVTDGTADPNVFLDIDTTAELVVDSGKVRVIDLNGSDVPETATAETSTLQPADDNCETYLLVRDSDDLTVSYPNALVRYGSDIYLLNTGISNIVRWPITDATSFSIFSGKNRFHDRNGKHGLPGRPKDLVITKNGQTIYYTENNRVKKISTDNHKITELVGNTVDNYPDSDDEVKIGSHARFSDTAALGLSKDEKTLYVIDRNNNRLRSVNIHDKSVSYLTGAGDINTSGTDDNGYQEGQACANEFDLDTNNCAYFNRPAGLAIDPKGKYAYVADTGNNVIRRVRLTGARQGETKLIAGNPQQKGFKDGTRKQARFNVPLAITINAKGTKLYVADRDNHAIRQIRLRDGKVKTITGSPDQRGYLDGAFADAYLNLPVEVYFDNGHVYFSETGTERIRVVDFANGVVKLVAGDGNRGYVNGDRDNAQFDNPIGLVRKGQKLLVADSFNDLIRKIDIGDGETLPFTEPAPTVTAVTPASNKVAGSDSDTKALSISGTNFAHGAVAYFGSYQANATYVNSDTELSVVIPFGSMDPGYYQVTVKNVDSQTGSKLRAYSVSDNSGNVPVTDYFFD